MLRELIYYEPVNAKTDINNSLIKLGRIVKKRSVIFVISDFISDDFEKSVKYLKNRHDVIFINLGDPAEKDIPDIGYALLEDEESGEQILVNTSDPAFRKAYSIQTGERSRLLEKKTRRLKIDMVTVSTDEPFHVPLKRFLKMRERRAIR